MTAGWGWEGGRTFPIPIEGGSLLPSSSSGSSCSWAVLWCAWALGDWATVSWGALEFNRNKVNEECFMGNRKVSTDHAISFAVLQTPFSGCLLIPRETSHKCISSLSLFSLLQPAPTRPWIVTAVTSCTFPSAADINFLFIEKSIRFELSKAVCTSGKDKINAEILPHLMAAVNSSVMML